MNREGTGPFADADVQLMLRVRDGDQAAFEELVNRHRRNVLNLVYRYLGDASAAEDVAQDVFVKVYRARAGYNPSAKFSTWLYRITVNHCLNVIRSRRARPVVMEPVEELVRHPDSEDPDAGIHRQELRTAVKAAIESLPAQQRMAVLLARFEDLSYSQIAETMDLSLEAVKSLLFRAKENLQRRLERFLGK